MKDRLLVYGVFLAMPICCVNTMLNNVNDCEKKQGIELINIS